MHATSPTPCPLCMTSCCKKLPISSSFARVACPCKHCGCLDVYVHDPSVGSPAGFPSTLFADAEKYHGYIPLAGVWQHRLQRDAPIVLSSSVIYTVFICGRQEAPLVVDTSGCAIGTLQLIIICLSLLETNQKRCVAYAQTRAENWKLSLIIHDKTSSFALAYYSAQ